MATLGATIETLSEENRALVKQQRKLERELQKANQLASAREEETVKRQRLEKQNLLQNVQVNQLSEQVKERERINKKVDKERVLLLDKVSQLETELLAVTRARDNVNREINRIKIELQNEIEDRTEFEALYHENMKKLKEMENAARATDSEKFTLSLNLKSTQSKLKALQAEKEATEKTVSDLRQSLSQATRSSSKLKNELSTVENELATFQSRYNRLEHQLTRQKKKLDEKERFHEEILADKDKKIVSTQKKLRDAQSDADDARRGKDASLRDVKRFKAEKERLEGEMEQMKTKHSSLMKEKTSKHVRELEDLQDEMADQIPRSSSLKDSGDSNSSDLMELKRKRSQLESKVKQLTEEMEESAEQIENFKKTLKAKENELQQLKENQTDLEDQIADAGMKIKQVEEENIELKENIAKQSESVQKKLQDLASKYEATIEEISVEKSSTSTKANEFEEKMFLKEKEIRTLQRNYEEAVARCTTVEEEMKEIQKELEVEKGKHTKTLDSLSNTEKHRDSLEKNHTDRDSDVVVHQQQMRHLKGQLEKSREEFDDISEQYDSLLLQMSSEKQKNRDALNECRDDYQLKLKQETLRYEESQERCLELEDQVDFKTETLHATNDKLEDAIDKIFDLENKVAEQDDKIFKLSQEKPKPAAPVMPKTPESTRMKTLRAKSNDLSVNLQQKEKELEEQAEMLERVQKNLTESHSSNVKIEKERNGLQKKVEELTAANESIEGLTQECTELTKELKRLRKEMDAQKQQTEASLLTKEKELLAARTDMEKERLQVEEKDNIILSLTNEMSVIQATQKKKEKEAKRSSTKVDINRSIQENALESEAKIRSTLEKSLAESTEARDKAEVELLALKKEFSQLQTSAEQERTVASSALENITAKHDHSKKQNAELRALMEEDAAKWQESEEKLSKDIQEAQLTIITLQGKLSDSESNQATNDGDSAEKFAALQKASHAKENALQKELSDIKKSYEAQKKEAEEFRKKIEDLEKTSSGAAVLVKEDPVVIKHDEPSVPIVKEGIQATPASTAPKLTTLTRSRPKSNARKPTRKFLRARPGSTKETNPPPVKTVNEAVPSKGPTRAVAMAAGTRRGRAATMGVNPFGGGGIGGMAGLLASEALKKKSNTGSLKAAPKAKASGPPVPDKTYSIEELKTFPADVDKARIEEWLKPEDFEEVMGIARDKYFEMAPWQRSRFKKKAGL